MSSTRKHTKLYIIVIIVTLVAALVSLTCPGSRARTVQWELILYDTELPMTTICLSVYDKRLHRDI